MKSSARFDRDGRIRSSSRTTSSRPGPWPARRSALVVLGMLLAPSMRDGALLYQTAIIDLTERKRAEEVSGAGFSVAKSPTPATAAAATTTAVSASSRRMSAPASSPSSR